MGLGFKVLSANEAAEIKSQHDRIVGLNIPEPAINFATAQYYAGQGLTAEAIEILEEMVEGGNQQAVVYQALADLYAQIGLLLLAEPGYLEAVELAETQGNIEAEAAIQAGLGDVYVRLGNKDKAIRRFTQAQAGYETLGDTEQAAEIAKRLERLNP